MTLFGNSGNDTLIGSDFNDMIYGGSGSDSFDGGSGNDRFYINTEFAALQGGAGIDWLYLNGATPRTLDLAALGIERITSYSANETIDGSGVATGIIADSGGGDDKITGGRYRDQITGGWGDDTIAGGNGKDTLTGGTGQDLLSGGGAGDRFIFGANDFAGSDADTADRITDFRSKQGDIIDLQSIDADFQTPLDDPFTFIAAAAFGHIAGELRFELSGGNTFVQGDRDGDGAADFTIRLDGEIVLTEACFVL